MTVTEFLLPESWLVDEGGPLYVQLRKRIESGISSGFLAPDMPIPPERDIARLTGLSRVTVRKAIAELVEKGVILQRQGSGSFVAPAKPRVEQSLSGLTSFSEDMARRGLRSDILNISTSDDHERASIPTSPPISARPALGRRRCAQAIASHE